MTHALIIDTDPSPDDAIAFLNALASPESFEILAIAREPNVARASGRMRSFREIDADSYFELIWGRLARI